VSRAQAGSAELGALLRALDAGVQKLYEFVPPRSGRIDWDRLAEGFFDALSDLQSALRDAGSRLEALGSGPGTAMCARRARQLGENLATLRAVEEKEGLRWAEGGSSGVTLHFTPFEIAERLRGYVEARPCAWIFTSATLALGDDFSHFAERIGLPSARALRIESPFDFREQARLYLPLNMPDPQDPAFSTRFIAACAPLLEASGGRAFLLFTSYRGLNEGLAALQKRFPDPPFPVLVQGQAPRDALLKQFRALGNAVLLATGSFWEGVDVKGDALSIVAIDKLPFASPDDPLLKARLEGIRRRGGNPFFEYQVPQAVLALKQGVGRLIRDMDDFGVILIGDPRLKTKGYGKLFLESLPPSPVITDGAQAAEFLETRLAAAGRL
jgi:ATP-dependent DNA helicase DinG